VVPEERRLGWRLGGSALAAQLWLSVCPGVHAKGKMDAQARAQGGGSGPET
jgi:hypothetical protein